MWPTIPPARTPRKGPYRRKRIRRLSSRGNVTVVPRGNRKPGGAQQGSHRSRHRTAHGLGSSEVKPSVISAASAVPVTGARAAPSAIVADPQGVSSALPLLTAWSMMKQRYCNRVRVSAGSDCADWTKGQWTRPLLWNKFS